MKDIKWDFFLTFVIIGIALAFIGIPIVDSMIIESNNAVALLLKGIGYGVLLFVFYYPAIYIQQMISKRVL